MLQAEMMNGTKDSFQRDWVIYQTYLAIETKSCVPGVLRQYTSLNIPLSHNFHYCGFRFVNQTVIKKVKLTKKYTTPIGHSTPNQQHMINRPSPICKGTAITGYITCEHRHTNFQSSKSNSF
jgi:hypothetical protein